MDENKGTNKVKSDKAEDKVEFGIYVAGMYLGAGQRTYGKGQEARTSTSIMVALPGLDGALEIGVPADVLGIIDDDYKMGQAIRVQVDKPRAYKDRIYYNAVVVGDIVCG